jgi:hypothetical protein
MRPGAGQLFEDLDDSKLAGRKSWKERLSEGAVILVVVAVVIGILVYVLISSRLHGRLRWWK